MIEDLAKKAKEASKKLAAASTEQKNRVLAILSEELLIQQEKIMQANTNDLTNAKGMTPALQDRLTLQGKLAAIASDVKNVLTLTDPIGEVFDKKTLPNGLHLHKVRVPIGVLGVVYEARPNVTIDISALAIKTGNAVVLRGGSETLETNRVLIEIIKMALQKGGLAPEAVQFVDSTDRTHVLKMLTCEKFIDMIIPRGGAGLHDFCKKESTIPVITGGIGICHLFVDESADLEKSIDVIINAKTQRPTVCNALDTLLVHKNIRQTFLPKVIEVLLEKGVEVRLDVEPVLPGCRPAGEGDWDREWLGLTLGVKIVSGLEEALLHIEAHSSGHSDGILTENTANAQMFVRQVDSAAVYVNASTRFTDGAEFGLGAEVAISTQKLHARGPMGLKELTTYKWVVEGNYTVRS